MEEAAIAAAAGSMGSVQWTAPEKLRGEAYGRKADVYSYGMVCYEVMARKVQNSKRSRRDLAGDVPPSAVPGRPPA